MVLWPVVSTGAWADTHEGARYALLFDQFRAAFVRGHVYPRWLPDLYGGYGYPIFCFYQPGFFFAALPFSFLPGKPPYWLYATLWALLTIGAAGAYQLAAEVARRLPGNAKSSIETGLFGAALFMLTPYLWIDLYVRGDLSELMGLCLSPWPLVALLRIADRTERGAPSLGAVFLAGASLAGGGVRAPDRRHVRACRRSASSPCTSARGALRASSTRRAALAIGLGLLLSSVYWYPLATLQHEVRLDRATQGYFPGVQPRGVPAAVLLAEVGLWRLGTRERGHDVVPAGPGAFSAGHGRVLLWPQGAVDPRRVRDLRGLCCVTMTPAGLLLWRHVYLFKLVQFPWRLLSATAALQILCAAGVSALAARPRVGRLYGLSLATLLVAGLAWYHDQYRIQRPIDLDAWVQMQRAADVRSTLLTHALKNEFLPQTAPLATTLLPRGKRVPILELSPPAAAISLAGDDEFLIHRLIQAAAPTRLTINQLFFPGWRVELDGASIAEAELRRTIDSEGRMTAALAAGNHTLRATYDGPPGWRVRVIAVVLGLTIFAVFWWRERRAAVPFRAPAA